MENALVILCGGNSTRMGTDNNPTVHIPVNYLSNTSCKSAPDVLIHNGISYQIHTVIP